MCAFEVVVLEFFDLAQVKRWYDVDREVEEREVVGVRVRVFLHGDQIEKLSLNVEWENTCDIISWKNFRIHPRLYN